MAQFDGGSPSRLVDLPGGPELATAERPRLLHPSPAAGRRADGRGGSCPHAAVADSRAIWRAAATSCCRRQTRRLVETAYGDRCCAIEPDPRCDAGIARPGRLALPPRARPTSWRCSAPTATCPSTRRSWPLPCAGLTGGTATLRTDGVYTIMAGRTGRAPVGQRERARALSGSGCRSGPCRSTSAWSRGCRPTRCDAPASVTSSSNRRHVLTLERGVSVVAFGPDRRPLVATYASGLFAPPTPVPDPARPRRMKGYTVLSYRDITRTVRLVLPIALCAACAAPAWGQSAAPPAPEALARALQRRNTTRCATSPPTSCTATRAASCGRRSPSGARCWSRSPGMMRWTYSGAGREGVRVGRAEDVLVPAGGQAGVRRHGAA